MLPKVLILMLLGGCGPLVARLGSLPTPRDGAQLKAEGAFRVAVVGATEPDQGRADALALAIGASNSDLLLLGGGMVRRSTTRHWTTAVERWSEAAPHVAAVPGDNERRGDRQLRGFHAVFDGQGVPDLGGDVPFSHLDITTRGERWRVVLLDASPQALGDRWLDQLFWLPKVVTQGSHDHLIVVINAPVVSLADARRADEQGAVSTLLDIVAEHAGATSLMAVLMGDSASNEIHMPGGSFGEAHVVAGNGSAPASDLWRRGDSDLPGREVVALVDGYDAALMEELGRRAAAGAAGPLSIERAYREAYPSDVLPIRGWWLLELQGHDMSVAFHLEDTDGGFRRVYRIHYTRRAGWVATPTEAAP